MSCKDQGCHLQKKSSGGRVIWITGLSGAGKTTLARALILHLAGAILLDGDALRDILGAARSGFDRRSRLGLAMIYARFCKLLADQGHIVVIATISLFHEVRAWNRVHLPGLDFLDASERVRRSRDPKRLYAAAGQGRLAQMAGQDTKVDMSATPHRSLATSKRSPDLCPEALLKYLWEECT